MKPDNKTDRVEEVKKKLKEDAIKKEDARQRTIDEINKDEEIRRETYVHWRNAYKIGLGA